MKNVLSTGTPFSLEFPYLLPEESKSGFCIDKSQPLLDSRGEIIGILGTVTDITEQALKERILRVRSELYEFSETHTTEELLQKTLDEICELTGSSIGFYHFVDPDQKGLTLQAWSTRTEKEFCQADGK